MENNSDRMGFALIALSVVAFVLLAVNGTLQPTVKGFFNGFNNWETQTFDGITESNKQDVTHTAYSWSADGADRFTTIKPNLNLLKGTRTLTATSNTSEWNMLFSSSQIYDSAIKSKTGVSAMTISFDVFVPLNAKVGNSFAVQLKGQNSQATNVGSDEWNTIIAYGGDTVKQNDLGKTIRISGSIDKWGSYKSFDSALSDTHSITIRQVQDTSGLVYSNIKVEKGSEATPYMPSASDVKPSDQPKFIGTYTDKSDSASQDPKKYTWKSNPDYHE